MKKFLLLTLTSSAFTSYGMNTPEFDANTIHSMNIAQLLELVSIYPRAIYTADIQQTIRPRVLALALQELEETGRYPNMLMNYLFPASPDYAETRTIADQKAALYNALISGIDSASLKEFQSNFRKFRGKQWINVIFDIGSEETTILGHALEKNRTDIIEFLLDQGADPNARINTKGETVLMRAAENGNVPLVQLLLSYGANPLLAAYPKGLLRARPWQGKTAEWFAELSEHPEVVQLLRTYTKERHALLQAHMPTDICGLIGGYLGEPEKVKKPKYPAAEDEEAQ